jgi:hypothetical protein
MTKKKKPLHKPFDMPERIDLPFPIPHDLPIPKEIVPVPLPVDPATIEHFETTVELIHCEATLVNPLFGSAYIWLKLPPGIEMPMEPGQTIKVDVQFSPPTISA